MLKLLSKIFGHIVKIRNQSYDSEKSFIYRCSVPVISIGNLSVGGSGKTPFVELVASLVLSLNKSPAIIGRSYKSKNPQSSVISDGSQVYTSNNVNNPESDIAFGDEMLLLAEKIKVPVLANKKKYVAAQIAEKTFKPDCIIVDDGFQHRALYRDLDILILDENTIQNPNILPAGRLREPLSNLNRADVIAVYDYNNSIEIINRFDFKGIIIELQRNLNKPYSIFSGNILPSMNQELIAFAGIANPDRFKDSLDKTKIKYLEFISFPDHHQYKQNDINRLIKAARKQNVILMATTEKDAVKLRRFSKAFSENQIDVIALPIKILIIRGIEQFTNKINSIL